MCRSYTSYVSTIDLQNHYELMSNKLDKQFNSSFISMLWCLYSQSFRMQTSTEKTSERKCMHRLRQIMFNYLNILNIDRFHFWKKLEKSFPESTKYFWFQADMTERKSPLKLPSWPLYNHNLIEHQTITFGLGLIGLILNNFFKAL